MNVNFYGEHEREPESESKRENNGIKEDVSGCETNCNYFFIQTEKLSQVKQRQKGKKIIFQIEENQICFFRVNEREKP